MQGRDPFYIRRREYGGRFGSEEGGLLSSDKGGTFGSEYDGVLASDCRTGTSGSGVHMTHNVLEVEAGKQLRSSDLRILQPMDDAKTRAEHGARIREYGR